MPDAVEAVQKSKQRLVTTEINCFEVFFGIYVQKYISHEEERAAKYFFDSLDVMPFVQGAGCTAARLLANLSKKGQVIEQNDALIAAVMLGHGCSTVLTKNQKHFSRIPGLTVRTY